MFIYNVTIKLHPAIETSWLQWQKEIHIPEILATKCFSKAVMVRLLDIDDDDDGPTYATQYYTSDRRLYDHYIATYAESLRRKNFDKWGDQFIAFRSLMEVVN